MAKIRQEINLVDKVGTGTNAVISFSQISQLDPTAFNGTLTHYFEIIGSATAGTTGGIRLRRSGTTTDDAVFSSELLAPVTLGSNLLYNGTLDSGISEWSTEVTNGTAAHETTVTKSGGGAGKVTATATATVDNIGFSAQTQTNIPAVSVGTSYRRQSWIRTSRAQTVTLKISWYNSSKVWLSDSTATLAIPADVWVDASLTATAPASAAYAFPNMKFTSAQNGDIFYEDEGFFGTSTASSGSVRHRVDFTRSSATEYFVYADAGGTSKTVTINAARIITLQDSDTSAITSTQSQIEIGNEQSSTSLTPVALTNPKYWKYTAANWNGTKTFYAEVTYMATSTKAPVSVRLEDDNGSFGSWAINTTIVNGGTATSPTRVRVSFTPTDGDNYRITIFTTSTKSAITVYNAKIIVDQTSSPTLLETQYMLLNTSDSGSTGLQNYFTLWESSEWSRINNTYKYAHDATNSSDSSKLVDIDNSNTDITNATVTGTNQQIASNAFTMPTTNHRIDVNVTNTTGAVGASRIIVYGVLDRNLSVSDSITVTESVTVSVQAAGPGYSPSLTDNVTVSESVQLQVVSFVNTSDSISVSESTTPVVVSLVSVSDSITVSEELFVLLVSLISVSDSVTLTEVLTLMVESYINVSDSITVSEAITALLVSLVSVSDSVSVTESTNLTQVENINVSDSISVSESLKLEVVSFVNVSDSITVSESPVVLLVSLTNVSDSITVSESLNLTQVFNVSVSDSISVSESHSELVTSFVNVSDSVSVSESIQLQVDSFINVSDSITVSENVVVAIASQAYLVNVSDSITVSESHSELVISFVNVSDSVTVSESLNRLLTSFIATSESITVTDIAQYYEDMIVVSESVQVVAQAPSTDLNINVSDSITVSEAIQLQVISYVNVSDSITVSENLSALLVSLVAVSDSISVSETISTLLVHLITVSESVTVTESVVLAPQTSISVTDSVSVTESVQLQVVSFPSVSDSIAVSENHQEIVISLITVSDSVTVTESVILAPQTSIAVSESITVSELVSVFHNVGLPVSASDSVTLTEAVSLFSPTLRINVSENITISEQVSANAPWVLSWNAVSDNPTDWTGGSTDDRTWTPVTTPNKDWSQTTADNRIWTDTAPEDDTWT